MKLPNWIVMSLTRRCSLASHSSVSAAIFVYSLLKDLFSSSNELILFCIKSRLMDRRPVGVPFSDPVSSMSLVRTWISSVFLCISCVSWVIFSLATLSSVWSEATSFSSFVLYTRRSFPIRAVSSISFSFCNENKNEMRLIEDLVFYTVSFVI